ncbi:MAG: hypothetical protein KDD11_20695 [Acidobacteria bacterium]|nr:hypothetical protein [Acidobacteriota bacterium]
MELSVTAVSTFAYGDRPTSLRVQRPGEPDLPIASGATYEPSGPLNHLDLGNGLTETRPTTNRYFPGAISVAPTTPLSGAPVLQWAYGTDNVGNILTIDDALTPANDKTYAYQDYQYFLKDGMGPWGHLIWTYDKIGNRLTEARDGVMDTYAYAPNAGTGHTALLESETPQLGGARSYTCGPAGLLEHVENPGNPVTFTSDDAGRLTRLERPAGDARSDFLCGGRSFLRWAEESSYSNLFSDGFETGDGRCWTLSEGSDINAGTARCPLGDQIEVVYSSEGVLHTVTRHPLAAHESTRFYLYLAGCSVAQLDIDAAGIATPTWLTTDHLGTPVVATDAAGISLWQGGFEPFGADYSGASLAGVDLRFPGQWVDGLRAGAGAGISSNGYRWFGSFEGRFSRPDPIGLNSCQRFKFGGLPPNRLYVYADNDPLGRFDSRGLKVEVCARPADLPVVGALGLPHKWIKTDTRSGGMGRANGEVPSQGQSDCPGIPTAVVDHSLQSGPDVKCMEVQGLDQECVNKLIQPGRSTGPWVPAANDCWRFEDDVVSSCSTRKPPFNPGRPGYRQSPLS